MFAGSFRINAPDRQSPLMYCIVHKRRRKEKLLIIIQSWGWNRMVLALSLSLTRFDLYLAGSVPIGYVIQQFVAYAKK